MVGATAGGVTIRSQFARTSSQRRDHGDQSRCINGLRHVRLEPCEEQPNFVFPARVGGERDCRNLSHFGIRGAQPGDECVAILARHADVTHQDIRLPRGEDRTCLLRRVRGAHLCPAQFQEISHDIVRVAFVVDYQNPQPIQPRLHPSS